MVELRTLAGMFVDLCDWISAELHYHCHFSEICNVKSCADVGKGSGLKTRY